MVSTFKQGSTGKNYLMVVSGYDQPASKPIVITLDSAITGLTNLDTGSPLEISNQSTSISLPTASAAIFEYTIN